MHKTVYISGGIGRVEPISIDVVGLPNVLKKDLASLNKVTSEEKEEPKKQELFFPENKKTAEKKSNLISKIKDAVDKEQNYLTKLKIIKGLQVQEGVAGGTSDSSQGTGVDNDTVKANPYFQTVKEYVRNYWKIPNWMKTNNLNALVLVKISDDGSISELNISQSSGNAEFDELALNSVRTAAPFPAPPVAVREVLESGIILSFP
jgi:periplasmic protein TonB